MKSLWFITLPLVLNITHGITGNETDKFRETLNGEADENEPNCGTEKVRTSSKRPEFNVGFIPRKNRCSFKRKKPQYPNTFAIPEIEELSKVLQDKSEPSSFHRRENVMMQNHCVQCNVSFRYDKHYAKHCKGVHGIKKPYLCEYCNYKFRVRYSLANHVNLVHGMKSRTYAHWKRNEPIVCDVCQETLPGWMKFEEHAMSRHEGMKMMNCPHCPKKFLRRKQMLKHEKLEHGNLKVKCEICKNIFERSDFLKEHMEFCERNQIQNKMGDNKADTIIRSVMLVCEECGDEHKSYALLRCHHRLKHPHVKLHRCHYCNAEFSERKSLEKHADMLHPDKINEINKLRKFRRGAIYTCEYCKENFKGTLAYVKHGKQHPGLPMFRCKDCGLGYGTRKSLSNHANEAHGSAKTRCSYCSKWYYRIRVHENDCKEKIWRRERRRMSGCPKHYCGICKRDFYMAKISFKKHVDRHKYYEYCPSCGQGFKKCWNRLGRHMVLRHPTWDKAWETVVKVETLENPKSLHAQYLEKKVFELGDTEDFEFNRAMDLAHVKCEDHDLYIYAKSEETD